MSLYVSTNSAAVKANFHLGRNSTHLQKSLARLSSGNRITQPADDAGGLAVSMKLKASINRLAGAESNIQNGVSFLEVQDGVLKSVGMIVDRMSELKGLSRDVMKNENDQATYNNEFRDLQVQLYDMSMGSLMESAFLHLLLIHSMTALYRMRFLESQGIRIGHWIIP